jgi:hypothetical protein
MLAGSLFLGCSVSSFVYRRQESDKYQTPIFIFTATVATMAGFRMDVSPNLVMLGVIPWALCFSMVTSVSVHWVMRRCSGRTKRAFVCKMREKNFVVEPGV